MANYYCACRSNYFRVKNAEEFKEFFKTVRGCEDTPELWEEPQRDGTVLYAFGCYGGISGIAVPPIGRIILNEPDGSCEDEENVYSPEDLTERAKAHAAKGYPYEIILYENALGNTMDRALLNKLAPQPVSIATEVLPEAWEADSDADYDAFLNGLQNHVAEGDAVIIMESGHEKLRYVTGYVCLVTGDGIDFFSMTDLAVSKAAEMLRIPEFKTRCDY